MMTLTQRIIHECRKTSLLVAFIWLTIVFWVRVEVPAVGLTQLPGQDAGKSETITPDEGMQESFRALVNIIQDEESSDEVSWYRNYEKLKQQYSQNDRVFVRQLIYFASQIEQKEKSSVIEAMLPTIVIDQLDISPASIAAATVPLLDTSDPTLRKVVKELLQTTEGDTPRRKPDFSHYAASLRQDDGQLRRTLVEYLFNRNMGEAVLTLMRETVANQAESRAILLAEHEVSDAVWKWEYGFLNKDRVEPEIKEAFLKITQSEHWWVRLYVARIMQKYPPFRDEVVLDRYEGDTDELVRAVVSEIRGTNNPK